MLEGKYYFDTEGLTDDESEKVSFFGEDEGMDDPQSGISVKQCGGCKTFKIDGGIRKGECSGNSLKGTSRCLQYGSIG